MTTISRERFIQDLSQSSLSGGQLPEALKGKLEAAGMKPAEIGTIGGADQVVNTKEEYGALYDRLVALEKTPEGKKGNFDYAQAMYDARAPAPPPPTTDLLRMRSDRPRITGVGGQPSLLPTTAIESMNLVPRSEVAKTIGHVASRQLDAAAQKDILGPAASAQRRIDTMTNKAVGEIEALEAKAKGLPKNSKERIAIEDQIDAKLTDLQKSVDVEMAQVALSAPKKEVPLLDKMKKGLPPYVQDSIAREGVVIPGVPGAIQPNTKNPGASWVFKF